MTEAGTRRVFFALWPDAAASAALAAAATAAAERCGGRRMRRDSLHMTLAFIGTVSAAQIEILRQVGAAVDAPPFDLMLDHLGWWPHNHIIWAGGASAPSAQRRLFAALAEGLAAVGFVPDPRPLMPHVTLLRSAHCASSLPALPAPIGWRAAEFTLVESLLQPSGARYRVLARWPLQSPT